MFYEKRSFFGAAIALVGLVSAGCGGVNLGDSTPPITTGSVVTCRCGCVDTCANTNQYVFNPNGIFIGCLGATGTTPYTNSTEAKVCVDATQLGNRSFENEACEAACDQLDIRYLGVTSTPLNPLRTCHTNNEDNTSPVVSSAANACTLSVGTSHSPLSTGDPGNPEKTSVEVDAGASSATVGSNGQSATVKPFGQIVMEGGNCVNAICGITLTAVHLGAPAFTLDGRPISNVVLENTGVLIGSKAADGTLSFASGGAGLAASGTIGSNPVGIAFSADPSAISGTYDPGSGKLSLNATATSADGTQSVTVAIQGNATQRPPQVNAGSDQTVACTGDVVHLDGSASFDPNLQALRFSWVDGNVLLGETANVDVTLSTPGPHDIRLAAVNEYGLSSTDVVRITVLNSSTPSFTFVPGPVTVADCAATPNIGQARASNACGSAVTITNDAPARFLPGRTVVTWKATDATGSSVTATQVVTVLMGDNPVCCPPNSHVVVGTANNDTLVGTSGVDCILGLGGQDRISGLGGDDYLSGGAGDDVISGGAGNDRIFGGLGQNTLSGGDGNDLVCGGDGDDKLNGDGGNDTLIGGKGQDRLTAGDGDDSLEGGAGDDLLDAGNGNDKLDGGGVHDVCKGGSGTNTFVNCETRQ